jgi:hypothetical protein
MTSTTVEEAMAVYKANKETERTTTKDMFTLVKTKIETDPSVQRDLLSVIERTGKATDILVDDLVNPLFWSRYISELCEDVREGPFTGYRLYVQREYDRPSIYHLKLVN